MSDKENSIHFEHRKIEGRYEVRVYMDGWNQPIDLFHGDCSAAKQKKVDKLYARAEKVYQKYIKPDVEWVKAK